MSQIAAEQADRIIAHARNWWGIELPEGQDVYSAALKLRDGNGHLLYTPQQLEEIASGPPTVGAVDRGRAPLPSEE